MAHQVSQANGIVNPYGAGDVRLDSTPSARYYMAQEAHKRAKDEALDRWFLDMQKNITPAGMRNQEIPVLVEKSKELQQQYLKNKAAIKNPALDNGAARTAYFGHYQDMMGLVQGSKNEKQKEATVAGILRDPEKRARLNPDFFTKLDEVQKVITDPSRVAADDLVSELSFDPKRLTPQQQQQQFKNYQALAGKPNEERVFISKDPSDKFNDLYEVKTKYTDDQLRKAGDNAIISHGSSPELGFTFSNPHPDNFEDLNKVYNRVYGKDIETPAEAHAAEAMYLMENQKGKQIAVLNKQRKHDSDMADFYAKQASRAALAKKAREHAHALKTGSEDDWLEGQVADLENTAGKDAKNRIIVSNQTGGSEKGLIMGAPAPVLKAFSVNSGGQNIEPDAIIKYADGQYAPVFYKRDKDFNVIKRSDGGKLIDETIPSNKMSRKQLKAAYGKAFATGANLTGQFDDAPEAEVPQSTERTPRFKGLPQKGKF